MYRFLENIVQKLYLIYPYSDWYQRKKYLIINSCQNEWICSYMNNQYRVLLSAVVAQSVKALHPLTLSWS